MVSPTTAEATKDASVSIGDFVLSGYSRLTKMLSGLLISPTLKRNTPKYILHDQSAVMRIAMNAGVYDEKSLMMSSNCACTRCQHNDHNLKHRPRDLEGRTTL